MSFVVKTFTNKKEMNLYLIKYRKNRLEEKLAKKKAQEEKAEKDLKQANKKGSIHELLYNTIPPNRFMNNGTDARRRSRRLHNEGLSKTMVPTVRRENQNVYDSGELLDSHLYNKMSTDECSRVIDAAYLADLPSGDDDGIWSVPSEEQEGGFIDDQDGFIDDPYYRNNNIVSNISPPPSSEELNTARNSRSIVQPPPASLFSASSEGATTETDEGNWTLMD